MTAEIPCRSELARDSAAYEAQIASKLAPPKDTAAPRVSVIIIFHNEERFLAEAAQSVFAQSFHDWELLLCDDGSTDASPDVARALEQSRPDQVRCVSHPGRANRGMSATRNLGLAHARGDFIGFLDADDVWLPNKLTEQLAVLEREPEAAMVYGRTRIWHSWSAESAREDFFYELGVPADRLYRPPELFEVLMANKAQSPTTCNALMRRDLFERVGGFEESFRGMFEDQVFFAKALLDSPAYVDDREWARYRQHPASCSAESSVHGGDEWRRLRFLSWLRAYMRGRNIAERRAWRAVRGESNVCRRALARRVWRRLKARLSGTAP